MTGFAGWGFCVGLGGVTGLLLMPLRGLLLMRGVRMVLPLEVLGLRWGVFAIPSHGMVLQNCDGPLADPRPPAIAALEPSRVERSVVRSISKSTSVRNGHTAFRLDRTDKTTAIVAEIDAAR